MAILKSLVNLLKKNKIKYKVVSHRTAYTAWDISQTQHVKPQMVAKTLVVKLDGNYVIACIPANKNLDFNKIKKVVNAARKKAKEKLVKKVSLAQESWMKKNLPGKVGATPPFGSIMKLPTILDKSLKGKILVNSGEYTESISIPASAIAIEKPLLGNISKAKK